MVTVKKKNKVLKVDEKRLDKYLQDGFDQVENGKVIKRATGGKVVSIGLYNKIDEELIGAKKEIKRLKTEITKLKK